MIYANYPKRKKNQKGPILTLLHCSTLKDWGWSPQNCSWDAVYPILVSHSDPLPPFSLLAMSYTEILPRYPAPWNSTGPICSVSKPNLTLYHKLCQSTLAQKLPRSSLDTHALNLDSFFVLVLIKKKRGRWKMSSFSHWKMIHFALSRFEKFFIRIRH